MTKQVTTTYFSKFVLIPQPSHNLRNQIQLTQRIQPRERQRRTLPPHIRHIALVRPFVLHGQPVQPQVRRVVVEREDGPLRAGKVPHGPGHAVAVQVLALPLVRDVLGPRDEVHVAAGGKVHLAWEDRRVADKPGHDVFATWKRRDVISMACLLGEYM